MDRHLPLFTSQLDLLVIAGVEDENLAALVPPGVLARYRGGQVVLTGAPGRGTAYRALLDALDEHGLEPLSAVDLPAFDMGDGARLSVVYDGPSGSAVRLEHGRASVLLAPALTVEDESALLAGGLVHPATALLLARHGSEKANQEAWLSAVNPRVVWLSIGRGLAPGLPSPASPL